MRHFVIGLGRWGGWLARRMAEVGFDIVPVHGRTVHVEDLDFRSEDWCWLCLPDDVLAGFAASISELDTAPYVLLHSSGTGPSFQVSGDAHTAVMWPVQSISTDQRPDWDQLPLVLQASSTSVASQLKELAAKLSGLPPTVLRDDRERQLLHLGAVLTQNFGNLLWQLTDEVLAPARLDYRTLLPLAANHLAKLERGHPVALQTGPAARADRGTISRQEELLTDFPHVLSVYRQLTEAILERRPEK